MGGSNGMGGDGMSDELGGVIIEWWWMLMEDRLAMIEWVTRLRNNSGMKCGSACWSQNISENTMCNNKEKKTKKM